MAVETRQKWLDAIEAASDDVTLLAMVADADQAAVQGLLRRHHLADPGLPSERLQSIREALTTGSLTTNHLSTWRDDVLAVEAAVEGISDFRKRHPLIEKFRAEHKLPPGNDASVLTSVREALWRGDLELGEWVEFLDQQRDAADRHVFIFRLSSSDVTIPDVHSTFAWKTPQPVLVSSSRGGSDKKVTLRLVGWRDPARRGAKGRRTVTFVQLDLTRRTMQLQLQRIRGGGMPALLAERDIYLREVSALLNIHPEPMRLEPAMRALLSDKRLMLRYWMVRTPDGGELSGKGEPGLFERARLGFERFYALELRARWKASHTSDLIVWMSARTDAIDVRTQCPPVAVEEFISVVCDHIDAAPQVTVAAVPEPDVRSDEDTRVTELKALLEKVVEYQRRLGEDVAITRPSRQTTADLLFTPDTLEEALNRFGVRSLGLTLYVMCPRTATPVRHDGHIVEFERPSDVPIEVTCENESETRLHPTKNNIWLKVGSGTTGAGSSPRTAWILFVVFFAALTWFFVWLRDTYPDQQWFILLGCLLAVLAPVAAIRWIYGGRAFTAAVEAIRGFLDAVLRKRQARSDEPHEPPADSDDEENA